MQWYVSEETDVTCVVRSDCKWNGRDATGSHRFPQQRFQIYKQVDDRKLGQRFNDVDAKIEEECTTKAYSFEVCVVAFCDE